jgi:hypothetical protein
MNSAREYCILSASRYSTHNRETAVVREVGETPNDRNDRGNHSSTPRTRHILIQSSSNPRWDSLVQHTHIPYASTNPRATATNTTHSFTLDRRRRESIES